MMRVVFVPEVAADLSVVRDWYESRAAGLGEDFLRMAYAAFSDLSDFPESRRTVFNHFRRAMLRRFPYSVYYLSEPDLVIVYGVFHSSRDPQAITHLLDGR